MKHTFVICAYKESPYLEACIRSLVGQTGSPQVLIVTSTPNSHIEGLANQYNLPYYINTGEGGITQDWNFGIACAKKYFHSEYVTVAHQDDIYEKGYHAACMRWMSRAKKPLIFFGDYYEIRKGRPVIRNRILFIKRLMLLPLRLGPFQSSVWIRRRILSLGCPICCPSVTIAVENVPEVVFANHYHACEDWEAWEKISRQKGAFLYCPRMVMGHRIHSGSETTSAIKDNHRTQEEFEMFCKFWPRGIARMLVGRYSKAQYSNQID